MRFIKLSIKINNNNKIINQTICEIRSIMIDCANIGIDVDYILIQSGHYHTLEKIINQIILLN